jgi:hypothetical protein
MESSASIVNKYISLQFVNGLKKESKLFSLKLSYLISSLILIFNLFLMKQQKNTTYLVYSNYFVSSFLIFSLCSLLIPYYVTNNITKTPFIIIFSFLLQIINVILFHEFKFNNKDTNLFFTILGIQSFISVLLSYRL